MSQAINLNADMAESFGAYTIGDDAALLPLVASANVACGFHGGDANAMHDLVVAARDRGVSIGAHPGFNDLWGFGRRQIKMSAKDIELMVAYQIGALQALARYAAMPVTHVKAHGALNNMAAKDPDYAMAIGRAIKAVDGRLIFLAVAGSEMVQAGETLGLRVAVEGFADRQYADDGQLASRALEGSVYREPAAAVEQVLRMVGDGEVVTRGGKRLAMRVDSICIHGDEPSAVRVAQEVRAALDREGIAVRPLPELMA